MTAYSVNDISVVGEPLTTTELRPINNQNDEDMKIIPSGMKKNADADANNWNSDTIQYISSYFKRLHYH
jgi:hypothetical protein